MLPQNRLENLSRFLGYGKISVDQRITWIGVEPGGTFWDSSKSNAEKILIADQRLELYSLRADAGLLAKEYWHNEIGIQKSNLADHLGKHISITERQQMHFSLRFDERFGSSKPITPLDLKTYYANSFCDGVDIQVNIYPLPKRSIDNDYEPDLKEYLGFPSKCSQTEIKSVLLTKERLRRIYDLIRVTRARPGTLTILLGAELRDIIRRRLFPDEEFINENYRNGYKRERIILRSKDSKVWCVPHPSGGGFTISIIDSILHKIRKVI